MYEALDPDPKLISIYNVNQYHDWRQPISNFTMIQHDETACIIGDNLSKKYKIRY